MPSHNSNVPSWLFPRDGQPVDEMMRQAQAMGAHRADDEDRGWSLYLALKDDLCWDSRAKDWGGLSTEAKEKVLGYLSAVGASLPADALTGCTPCSDCGTDYAALTGAWLVSDECWQRFAGTDPSIVLCPRCFISRVDAVLSDG